MFFGGLALCVLLVLAICCVKSCAKKCRAQEDPPIDGGGDNVWRNRFGSLRQSYRRAFERARQSRYNEIWVIFLEYFGLILIATSLPFTVWDVAVHTTWIRPKSNIKVGELVKSKAFQF
jgi:hypothetical protein